MMYAKHFFSTYLQGETGLKIVEIGSQDVNGSLKSVAPVNNDYIGVDFVEGKGVDIILSDPYVLPFEDSSIDVILSSSCYEHSEFFWLSFNEALRILKPTGLLYINAPSNGPYHRYPVDCWRFYPDSGVALEKWANRSGYECALLESFTGVKKGEWIDFDRDFPSNHNGTYKKHGSWAFPVYPTNRSLQGSPKTPYIWDDRCTAEDAAEQIFKVYSLTPEERKKRGDEGRKWAIGDEAGFTAEKMSNRIIDAIDELFDTWEPREKY